MLSPISAGRERSWSGCAAGAAGTGAIAYVRGELHTTLNQPFKKTEPSADRVLNQLKWVKINETKDTFVVISTQLQIRVGRFGDETRSLAVLDEIKANFDRRKLGAPQSALSRPYGPRFVVAF